MASIDRSVYHRVRFSLNRWGPMPRDYVKLAQQAKIWSMDASLPPGKRMLASHLCELAEMLSDPQYGCPSEHYAVEVMYRKLWGATCAEGSAALLACLGNAEVCNPDKCAADHGAAHAQRIDAGLIS